MFIGSGLNIPYALTLLYYIFGSLYAIFFLSPSLTVVSLFVLHYIWISLANGILYHRFLSHRSFEMHPFLQYFLLLGGLIGYLGSPYEYVIVHRYHHKNSDKDVDPHSPKKNLFWANILWLFFYDKNKVLMHKKLAKDLENNRLIKLGNNPFLMRTLHIFYALFLYFSFDITAVFWGLTLPNFLSFQFNWMAIASLCHWRRFKSKKTVFYDTGDNSLNIHWLTVLSFGESLHHNHHYKPGYANFDHQQREIDFGFIILKLLSKLNLVWDLKVCQKS